MFSVTVRSHVFIAHSLKGEVFGPASRLHGATLIVEAEFSRPDLDENNIVIDIAAADRILHEIAGTLNYRNLDELEVFRGKLTTVEYLAQHVHGEFQKRLEGGFKGTLKVTLRESPQAWASYAASINE
ncbi:MAG: 6-carboxytetrahydropterin synthase [Acidobacteriota bacterium]